MIIFLLIIFSSLCLLLSLFFSFFLPVTEDLSDAYRVQQVGQLFGQLVHRIRQRNSVNWRSGEEEDDDGDDNLWQWTSQ